MPAREVSVGPIAHQAAPASEAPAGKQRRHPRQPRRRHLVRRLARRHLHRRHAQNPVQLRRRHEKHRVVEARFNDGAHRATRVHLLPHRALKHQHRLRPRAPVAARFSAGVFRGRNGRNLRATHAASPRQWEVSSVRLGNATRSRLNQLRRRQYKRCRKQFKHCRRQS